MSSENFTEEELVTFATRILTAQEVPSKHARLVAESLVHADIAGQESHGLLRLPWYSKRLQSGAIVAQAEPTVVTDAGAFEILDGRDGLGQVLVSIAGNHAAEKADMHGIGAVGVRNSNHFGTVGYWTRNLAKRGYVTILTTNSSPAMAPWGGVEKRIGSNPWSIAAPGGQRGTVVLDMSNSLVARGKIYAAIQNGTVIPDDWALDENGLKTTDPHAALQGTLQPIGDYKGYGISFMMDVLAGILTGSGTATELVGPYVPTGRSRCGHLLIAIKLEAAGDAADFARRMDQLIDDTTEGPRANPDVPILVPGMRESAAVEHGRDTGVRLPQRTLSDLKDLAESLNVEFSLAAGR